jgi:RNA polymerase sigma-70 factor, ECF subfamily
VAEIQRPLNTAVMDSDPARSTGMEQTLVADAKDAPKEADLAFDRLYRTSRDDVYAYVASLLRDAPAAEEVTATAFERAYRKRNRFDPQRGEPRAWLFGIARNAALDELRRRGRQAELTAEPADLQSYGSEERVEHSERRLAVSAALERLEPRERELISLKFFAGLSNAEIAQVVGISESNAGTKLHRAMTKLREACNEAL